MILFSYLIQKKKDLKSLIPLLFDAHIVFMSVLFDYFHTHLKKNREQIQTASRSVHLLKGLSHHLRSKFYFIFLYFFCIKGFTCAFWKIEKI